MHAAARLNLLACAIAGAGNGLVPRGPAPVPAAAGPVYEVVYRESGRRSDPAGYLAEEFARLLQRYPGFEDLQGRVRVAGDVPCQNRPNCDVIDVWEILVSGTAGHVLRVHVTIWRPAGAAQGHDLLEDRECQLLHADNADERDRCRADELPELWKTALEHDNSKYHRGRKP